MIMQYNVTVQHEFSGNNFLSVGWVGSLGRHLGTQRDINQIPDGVSTQECAGPGGNGGIIAMRPATATCRIP